LVNRVMYGVSVSLLFALNGAAQIVPAEKTAKTGFVVLNDRDDVLQEIALTRLSAEDVQMIIEDEARNSPRALAALANDPEQRKKVLETLGQALAVASEARKTGFAEQETIKIQLELARMEILAVTYNDRLKKNAGQENAAGPPFNYIEDKDVSAFFAAPANKVKYDLEQERLLKYIRDTQKSANPQSEIDDEQKQFIISQWKKVIYGAVKATEMGLADRKTELLYKLQQALILARAYSQEKLKDLLTPTADEIKAYITANPKFSKEAQRAKAEKILAKVKDGGDFAALANEYSDDPGNKDAMTGEPQGGLYDWKSRNSYVKEFSDAAWALEAGQTSGIVETQFGYHIIKLEGKRTEKTSGQEEVKVRHILVWTMYKGESDSAIPSMTMEEAAKKELEKQKEKKVLDEITLRNPIALPDDFAIAVTKDAAAPPPEKTAWGPVSLSNINTIRSLPGKVKNYLSLHYKGWKLSPSEKGCTQEINPGYVSGDFNGDGKFDYAVKFSRGKKGYILAFLALKIGFKPFVLHDTDAAEVKYLGLGILKKGSKYSYDGANGTGNLFRLKYDAPSDYQCESDVGGIHYYRKGKFVGY